jgi:hypothetical protein
MTTPHATPASLRPLDAALRRATDALFAATDDQRTAQRPAGLVRVDAARQRLDRAVLDSLAFLLPLQVLMLPTMSEGVDEPPGTPDTQGDISTLLLSPGGAEFQADLLQQPDENPNGLGMPSERWWLHTWAATAAFPAAPVPGRLYFQFSVDVDFLCITPGADTRGVYAFTTLKSTEYTDLRFPLQVPQFTALEQTARVDLTGSIPVTTGQQLDVNLSYGMLLFAGNDEFASQGGFTAHRTVPQPTSADTGLIEYRFVPEWWITNVNRLTGLLDDRT